MSFINRLKNWLPLHKLLVAYCLFTIFLSFLPGIEILNIWAFYVPKLIIIAIVLCWQNFSKYFSLKGLQYINAVLGIGFLAFFYNETGQLNNLFFNPLDPLLARTEEWIFGFQPSILFSIKFSSIVITELMNLGYLSYYFIIIGFALMTLYRMPQKFDQYLFIISCSFIVYYTLFIIIPSWGPQFYFSAPANQAPEGVFFQKIIALIQHEGEAKTGAIPSSHVGITLIISILSYRHFKFFFWCILPFVVLLVCSTVYIKAHYVIDIIAGFITAPMILYLSQKCWNALNKPS